MTGPININPELRKSALTDGVYFDDGTVRLNFSDSLMILALKENLPPETAGSNEWQLVDSYLLFQVADDLITHLPAAYTSQQIPADFINYWDLAVGGFPSGGTFADLVQFNVFHARHYFMRDLDNALQKFNGVTNRIPQSFDAFIQAINSQLSIPLSDPNSGPPPQLLKDLFQMMFEASLGIRSFTGAYPPGARFPDNGDLSVLSELAPPITPEILFEGDSNTTGFFQEFARTYSYGSLGLKDSGPAPADDANVIYPASINFFLNFFNEMAATVSLNSDPPSDTIFSLNDLDSTGYAMNSYERVFMAFNPNATFDDFKAKVQEFYLEVAANRVAFVPSRVFDAWVEKIQTEFVSGVGGDLSLPFLTSLSGNRSEKALVITRILRLVSDIIETMQRITATQARQLDFLTELQKNYTTLQDNIPIFTENQQGLGSTLGGSGGGDPERRQELNGFNQQIIEIVRGRKQIEENNAKQVQTLVNQSNDAVNQQAEIASTLLQQLSSLLQAIYR